LIFEDDVEIGSVGFFHDLTARKEMEEELRRRSITDSLTNLYNRRHFHSTLSEEIARSARYRGPLSLAVFDLDNFKAFNDTYGHQEGDAILCLVAECIRAVFRSTDYTFRLGGDEFGVLLVETELSNAGQVMERFKRLGRSAQNGGSRQKKAVSRAWPAPGAPVRARCQKGASPFQVDRSPGLKSNVTASP
jgi:diguanylate cyclase (GGDEF)-like protein